MLDTLSMGRASSSLDTALNTAELEGLLGYLKRAYRVDLTGYKRPSLMRRVRLRMHCVGAKSGCEYLAWLKQQPAEISQLLGNIFINHTYFFRDRSVWDLLEREVIPPLVASKGATGPIRIWSAGCASGEETYSLAMLLLEALGVEQFQQRVQIHGTDVDPEALLQAHLGCYPSYVAELIPPAFLQRYFEQTAKGYCWRQDLRGPICFYPHNLIQSPPPVHIDLLICRNTLMYFTSETQLQVLKHLHSSLSQDGFLLLGKTENLVTWPQRALFAELHPQAKVFTKASASAASEMLSLFRPSSGSPPPASFEPLEPRLCRFRERRVCDRTSSRPHAVATTKLTRARSRRGTPGWAGHPPFHLFHSLSGR